MSGTYVSEALLILVPTITAKSPYVNKSDILRRVENIDRPVASEPLMKPCVLQIAFTYRQTLTKCLKLQGPWCSFVRLEANQRLQKLQESNGCLKEGFNCAF
jgi:hypothetical protein